MSLLTMERLGDGVPLMIADFKDTHALFHIESERFIGLTRNRGIRLGKPPLVMTDGIWFLEEDLEIEMKFRDLNVGSTNLVLRVIR